jgi:hypothetical protein
VLLRFRQRIFFNTRRIHFRASLKSNAQSPKSKTGARGHFGLWTGEPFN